MPEDLPFVHREVVARKTGGPGRQTWEVGIPNNQGSTDKSFGESLTTDKAHAKARFVNQVMDWFIKANSIPIFDEPLVRRKTGQEHVFQDAHVINIMQQWLTVTDALEAELEGALVAQITRVRDHIVKLLQDVGFTVKRDGGLWYVLPPKKE